MQEWFETWLAGLRVVGLEDSTIDSHDRNLHNHVLPTIGAARLQGLTPVDLDRLYARLLSHGRRDGRGGLSAKTVRYISTIIGKALSDAEKKGLVARNVARAATAPSAKAARAPEMKFWTPTQLRAFFDFLADDDLLPLVRLTAMTGARRGEMCGLRWDDVDLDAGRVAIRRQRISIRRLHVLERPPAAPLPRHLRRRGGPGADPRRDVPGRIPAPHRRPTREGTGSTCTAKNSWRTGNERRPWRPSWPSSPSSSLDAMSRLARVVDVEHLGEHRLRLTFSDGLVRELDFADAVQEWGGVFEPLSDPAFFAQVAVDPVAGTVAWPNGVDLDPDVLHGDHAPASGRSATVLKQYRLRPTG